MDTLMSSAIRYPNDRTNPAGAIPVYFSSGPKAIPIKTFSSSAGRNFGPIPVRVVAGPGSPPIGSDQGDDNNVIPVFESTASNAMPVWDAAPVAPIQPPVVSQSEFSYTLPVIGGVDSLGNCIATNLPVIWNLIDDQTGLCRISSGSGQLVIIDPNDVAAPGTYLLTVQATNSGGNGLGTIRVNLT
jgi:hypothetical protein